MKKKLLIYFSIISFIITSCQKTDYSQFLLLSDLEAPLGWQYFTIYKDSTFDYVSRGITRESVREYKGKATILKDTIFLDYYKDSIPVIGKRVYYQKDFVEFIDISHKVRFKARLNKLKP